MPGTGWRPDMGLDLVGLRNGKAINPSGEVGQGRGADESDMQRG